jgi:hypothetical protein
MPVELTSPPAAPKRRERRHPCRYPFVRKVNGDRYQLRVYIGGGRRHGMSINLGLFPDEWSAGQAYKRAVRLLKGQLDPVSVWEQLGPLRADGSLPRNVLPMHVRRIPGDPERFEARVRRGKVRCVIGPFADPAEAGRAALRFVAATRAAWGNG